MKLEMYVDSKDESNVTDDERLLYGESGGFHRNKPRELETSTFRVSLLGDSLRISGKNHRIGEGREKDYCEWGYTELDREALQKILDKAIEEKMVRLPEISDEEIKAKLVHLPGFAKLAQAKRDLEQALKEIGVADDTP